MHSTSGKSASGEKKLKIKANDISNIQSFSFNKSIIPHGGIEASMSVSLSKKGLAQVKLFQDLNDDGIVSRDELIYKGKSSRILYRDQLVDFTGDIKLTKSMHKCEWITGKYPHESIMCTREYIPTLYNAVLTSSSGKRFVMEGMGDFAAPDVDCCWFSSVILFDFDF